LAIIGLCLFFRAVTPERRSVSAMVLGSIILCEICLTHLYLLAVQGTWSLSASLPLELCRVSFLIAGIALVTKSQALYEWAAYLGLPSGLEAILTPELTQGTSRWMLFDYYCSHSLLIAVPIVMSAFLLRKPRRWAAGYVFLTANALAAVVFWIDVAVGANYMFLLRRPLAKSPFLVGPWPWYIVGLELAAVLHIVVMDVLFRVRPYRVLVRERKSAAPLGR
jgi:hypothetical integral membrane protein (TIGR02206 family)